MSDTLTISTTYRSEDCVVRPGEGEESGSGMVMKILASDMDGYFGMMEGQVEPKELLAPHTHEFETQAVYIIEGELEFEVGGEGGLRFSAGEGSYIIKPKGVQHCFWNATDSTVRYIELSTGDKFEGFISSTDSPNKVRMVAEAQEVYGITWHTDRIPTLLSRHKLRAVSGVELPPWLDVAAMLYDAEQASA